MNERYEKRRCFVDVYTPMYILGTRLLRFRSSLFMKQTLHREIVKRLRCSTKRQVYFALRAAISAFVRSFSTATTSLHSESEVCAKRIRRRFFFLPFCLNSIHLLPCYKRSLYSLMLPNDLAYVIRFSSFISSRMHT